MPKSGQTWNRTFLEGHPLFSAFEAVARPLRTARFPDMEMLSDLVEEQRVLRTPQSSPLRFVEMTKKPRRRKRERLVLEELYDGSIELLGQVPCLHESYHDLFNAIAFAAFGRAKRALHRRQFAALSNWVGTSPQLPGRRTREQDALTIFDEGGVVILMDENYFSQWRQTSAKTLIPGFAPDRGVVPLLFGHALLEHLFEGHTQVRASAVVILVDADLAAVDLLDVADRALARRLSHPTEFREPGADGIFTMDGETLTIGPPKPAWSAWDPADRDSFVSRYAPRPEAVRVDAPRTRR